MGSQKVLPGRIEVKESVGRKVGCSSPSPNNAFIDAPWQHREYNGTDDKALAGRFVLNPVFGAEKPTVRAKGISVKR